MSDWRAGWHFAPNEYGAWRPVMGTSNAITGKQWPHPDFVRNRIAEDAEARLARRLPTIRTTLDTPADCELEQIPSVGDGYVVSAVHMCAPDWDATLTLTPAGVAASVLPHSTDMVPAEQHYREVKEMRAEIELLEKRLTDEACMRSAAGVERDEAIRERDKLSEDYAQLERLNKSTYARLRERDGEPSLHEQELAALRYQLRLAEERKRPARHRPGAVVNVGWDPEGD